MSSRSSPIAGCKCKFATDLDRFIMNKFLKKKAPEALIVNNDAPSSRSTAPASPTSPGPKKSNGSRWRKNKKQAESKPSFDLSSALPPSDDFRTSLLMPNLSARFSMLREQDDPSSLLGKASDDSVLQPRRRSRMIDFGYGNTDLSDIAEVSSLSGSIRPPFAAPWARQPSFVSEDGYGSDADITPGGSVMSRSRPGEGNNLFGGRQKIYKISGNASSRSLGKALYEDDIGVSAFQRYRRERAAERAPSNENSMGFDFGLDDGDNAQAKSSSDSSRRDRPHSPSLDLYDKKRSTASSTTQSDARSSTAATSITSPSIASAATSPSLAGPQQSGSTAAPVSLLDRTNPKARRLYEQGLDQHMHDQQASALTRLNSIQRHRTAPKQIHSAKSTSNLQDRAPQPVYALRTQSPTNLPPQQVSNSGSLRKLQTTGTVPNPSSPGSPVDTPDQKDVLSRALEPADRGKATALGAFNKPQQAFDEQQYMDRQLQLHRSNSNALNQQPVQSRIGRFEQESQRSSSDTSRARSQSSTRRQESVKPGVQANKTTNSASGKSSLLDTHRTFFGDISASDSEDEDEPQQSQSFSPPDYGYGIYHGRWQPTVLPSVSEHPALRNQKSKPDIKEGGEDEEEQLHQQQQQQQQLEPAPLRPKPSARTLISTAINAGSVTEGVDSPTLGIGHQPLNGMVHHLRQQSNQSSIYPSDDTVADEDVSEAPWNHNKSILANPGETASRHDSTYTSSNPWDAEETDGASVTEQNSYLRREGSSDTHNEPLPAWQHDLRRQHNRDASSATQQERDAFANELATRRNAIQESIKKQVEQREAQSRNVSPARSASGPFKALGMMRSKSSKEALAASRDAPSKAQRIFGMATGNQSSTSIASQSDRNALSIDVPRSHTESPPVPPMPNTAQHPAFQQSTSRDWEMNRQHPAARSTMSSNHSHERSRSNSTTTNGRSRSRTGPYRDDLERAMVEGTGSSTSTHGDIPYMLPREFTPRPSPDVAMCSNDGSKQGMTNYFEPKSSLTLQTAPNARLNVQGPSPVGYSPSGASPMSAVSATPSVSSTSTPAVSPGVGAPSRQPTLTRRKTISKSDISTPRLISSTSNVDTIDLPEGASLMNGSDEAPPIPPINPRRRGPRQFFNRARNDSMEKRSATYSDHAHASSRDFDANGHPIPLYNYSHPSSPERIQRSATSQVIPSDNGMF